MTNNKKEEPNFKKLLLDMFNAQSVGDQMLIVKLVLEFIELKKKMKEYLV